MQIGVLGPFEVRSDDGTPTDVPGTRLRALLIALALDAGHVVPTSRLIDWIWGEQPPADAANALQRLVSRLRKVLPDGMVQGQPNGYRLTVDPDAVDALRFERLVGRARDDADPRLLRAALAAWRGTAMQDVDLADSAAFTAAATRLDGLRLTAMEDRFDAEIELGHGAELTTELSDLVAEHPVRERLAAALMRALVASGRDSEALLVYQRTREALADALGVDPGPELSTLHVALLRGESGAQQRRRTNLRAELTSFVGKDTDLAAVGELATASRLITLVGPGGSGKTRLATETARRLQPPDGVWLVELAPVGSDDDLAASTLAALNLRDTLLGAASNAAPVDRLVVALRERALLLILDNCEHVIDSAAAFADRVLGDCPRLQIIATSREPLGITGEVLWTVQPLGLPPPGAGPDEIERASAVRLLRDRASAVRRLIADDADTAATLARICRALDGMPLAIELAAARLRTMSLHQLADRLDDRFRLLTGGSRTALPRHRTLRAVVDWSWELLTGAERAVLRRLSVFSGGANLDAAERVCAGAGVAPEQVLELLTALAEKSLLVIGDDATPRYRMLTTIREYAADRLADAGESTSTRRAHLAWFTELAERADPHLRRAAQRTWLATLAADHDNITAAMRGAIATGTARPAMALAAAAGWYWWLGGRRSEGLELLIAAVDLPGEVDDQVRAVTYGLMALYLTSGRGDEHTGAEWIHRAYRLRERAPGLHPLLDLVVPLERMLVDPAAAVPAYESLLDSTDPWVRALARWQVVKMRIVLGQRLGPDDDTQLAVALAEFRTLGERFGISLVLSELAGRSALRGDLVGACAHLEQAIAVVAEIGAVEDVIEQRSRQAVLWWLVGDRAASAAAIAEAERIADTVTWPSALVDLALGKAALARLRGDPGSARHQIDVAITLLGEDAQRASVRADIDDLLGYLAEDLDESRLHRAAACRAAAQTGSAPLLARAVVGVADLAVRLGRYDQAARLVAAAVQVRGSTDRGHPDEVRIERATREHLGPARFAEQAEAGTRTDWSALVAATFATRPR